MFREKFQLSHILLYIISYPLIALFCRDFGGYSIKYNHKMSNLLIDINIDGIR